MRFLKLPNFGGHQDLEYSSEPYHEIALPRYLCFHYKCTSIRLCDENCWRFDVFSDSRQFFFKIYFFSHIYFLTLQTQRSNKFNMFFIKYNLFAILNQIFMKKFELEHALFCDKKSDPFLGRPTPLNLT